jgi:hypothetical protein
MCQENPDLIKIGQKYQTLEMKSFINFIVAGNIKILSLTEMVSGSSSATLTGQVLMTFDIGKFYMTICLEISNLVNMG